MLINSAKIKVNYRFKYGFTVPTKNYISRPTNNRRAEFAELEEVYTKNFPTKDDISFYLMALNVCALIIVIIL